MYYWVKVKAEENSNYSCFTVITLIERRTDSRHAWYSAVFSFFFSLSQNISVCLSHSHSLSYLNFLSKSATSMNKIFEFWKQWAKYGNGESIHQFMVMMTDPLYCVQHDISAHGFQIQLCSAFIWIGFFFIFFSSDINDQLVAYSVRFNF